MLPGIETPSFPSGFGTQSLSSAPDKEEPWEQGMDRGAMSWKPVVLGLRESHREMQDMRRGEGLKGKAEFNPGRTFQRVTIKTEDLGKENSGRRSRENSTEWGRFIAEVRKQSPENPLRWGYHPQLLLTYQETVTQRG